VHALRRPFSTESVGLRGKLRAACQLKALSRFMNATAANVSSKPVRRVAVYGTLRQGGSNDITRLQPAPRFVGLATLQGRLYHLGAYPGLVLDARAGAVKAEVYEVSAELEAVLDAIEAEYPAQPDEYAKREMPIHVRTQSGDTVLPCFVYEINPRYVVGKAVIESGDWIAAAERDAGTNDQ
jgi:gamma-glutamylcyclotransferase (GGCT)/AIG2-like uncharacterized protein YtfP